MERGRPHAPFGERVLEGGVIDAEPVRGDHASSTALLVLVMEAERATHLRMCADIEAIACVLDQADSLLTGGAVHELAVGCFWRRGERGVDGVVVKDDLHCSVQTGEVDGAHREVTDFSNIVTDFSSVTFD